MQPRPVPLGLSNGLVGTSHCRHNLKVAYGPGQVHCRQQPLRAKSGTIGESVPDFGLSYTLPASLPRFEESFREIRSKLCSIIWPGSRHSSADWDGGHYSLCGYSRPVSVSAAEATMLAFATDILAAETILEIGTGFGYSTAWLGFGASLSGGHVISVDDHSEGSLGTVGSMAAASITRATEVNTFVDLVDGRSPDAVIEALSGRMVNLAFIDGSHNGDQPRLDFNVAASKLADEGVIIFHDVFYNGPERRNTVYMAVDQAAKSGFALLALDTSCQPVAVSRSTASLRKVSSAFLAAYQRVANLNPSSGTA